MTSLLAKVLRAVVTNGCQRVSTGPVRRITNGLPLRCTASAFAIHDGSRGVEVRGSRWPHSLHLPHMWLRDHCRCPHCYTSTTNQRSLDIALINPAIQPCVVALDNDVLRVTWPDLHESEYTLEFLWRHGFAATDALSKQHKKLWAAKDLPALDTLTVSKETVVGGGAGLSTLISNIEKFGLGIVSGVTPDLASTESLVTELCPVNKTFFGEMWSFTADLAHADTAFTAFALGAHTDGTYFTQPGRIQVFHCLHASQTGGETLLVDGFHVAQQLHKAHPQAYNFFSKKFVCGEYIGDGQHHSNTHTMLTHDPITGALQQFRYNLYDRAPVSSLEVADIHDYYKHLRTITTIIRNPLGELWVKLMPGSVLFLDNWRVMHGRAEFSGHRTMAGCYLHHDDYTSKARVLGLIR